MSLRERSKERVRRAERRHYLTREALRTALADRILAADTRPKARDLAITIQKADVDVAELAQRRGFWEGIGAAMVVNVVVYFAIAGLLWIWG